MHRRTLLASAFPLPLCAALPAHADALKDITAQGPR